MSARPTLTLPRAKAPAVPKPTPPPLAVPRARFWFLWSPTERAPHRRHPTLAAALAEAERLRVLAPEKEFLIYNAALVTNPTESFNEP